MSCPACCTSPRHYYIDLPWKGKKIKLYSDQDGISLESWPHATRVLEHIRLEIDRGIFDPRNYAKKDIRALVFENYFAAWLARRRLEIERGHLSRSYLRSVEIYGYKYLLPFFGHLNIRDVTAGHLEDFRNSLPAELKPKTVQNIFGILHKIMADAVRRQDMKTIPEFPPVPVSEQAIKWINQEDQEKILAEIKDPIRKVFYRFLMLTGCRPGEARALRWEDINWKNQIVTIRAAMDLETYRSFTKERDIRYLPLHPELVENLKALPRSLSGYIFTYRGKPLQRKTVWQTWKRAAQRAGIEIGCYQGTKHSLGCRLLNSGVREEILQALFGHKDRKSTKRYAKLMSDSLKYWEKE